MEPMKPMKPMKPMEPMEPMEPMKPMEPMEPMEPAKRWWSADLGEPDSAGSQNDVRYAYFDAKHRLAVDRGGRVEVYDTGHRRISGFGQRQGGGDAMTFESGSGPVALAELKKIG